MTTANQSGRGDIEDLLPWHAAGTLSPHDTQRVQTALAEDPELARRYQLVREELAQTIHLNESVGAPLSLEGTKPACLGQNVQPVWLFQLTRYATIP